MKLLCVIKPYELEVYTEDKERTLLGQQSMSRIDGELPKNYEQRLLFVAKEVALDVQKNIKNLKTVHVVLCYPWCMYEHVDVKKTFATDTSITPEVLDSLKIQKSESSIRLLESEIAHIALNGYPVVNIDEHKAREIEVQLLNVYTQASLHDGLRNTFESIFHLQPVTIGSVYAYAMRSKPKNGLSIIIEEESIDIAYSGNGKVLGNICIPNAYTELEKTLMKDLDADAKTVRNILASRAVGEKTSIKSLKHIWPDLEAPLKDRINTLLKIHYDVVLQHVYTLLNHIKVDRNFDREEVRVCALNSMLISTYGLALAKFIKDDLYIRETLRVDEKSVFIDYLF